MKNKDLDFNLRPFFKGNIIYNETCLFLGNEEISLLFPIKKIISVKNYALDEEYVEGDDFVIKNGKISRTKDSRMPFLPFDEYYLDEPNDKNIVVKVDKNLVQDKAKYGKYLKYGELDTFTKHQVAITYEHSGIWDGNLPIFQGNKIEHFFNKLKSKKNPTIVFYGDSITVGCNASGTEFGGNVKPYMPNFATLVTKQLETLYNSKINYINTAVGGMDSLWGINNVKERVAKYNPDLVVIGFGMNDGLLPLVEFKQRLLTMMDEVLKTNPNAEFILISTTVANNESNWYNFHQPYFIHIMNEIDLPNVVLVDMTHTHLNLLKHKSFKDMTGNNVNHPNDFLSRIYAQMILGSIVKI